MLICLLKNEVPISNNIDKKCAYGLQTMRRLHKYTSKTYVRFNPIMGLALYFTVIKKLVNK